MPMAEHFVLPSFLNSHLTLWFAASTSPHLFHVPLGNAHPSKPETRFMEQWLKITA